MSNGPERSLIPFDTEDAAFQNLLSAILSEEATIYIGEHPEVFSHLPFNEALEKSIHLLGTALLVSIENNTDKLIRTEKGLRSQLKKSLKAREEHFIPLRNVVQLAMKNARSYVEDYGLNRQLLDGAANEYRLRFGLEQFPFSEQLPMQLRNASDAMKTIALPFVEETINMALEPEMTTDDSELRKKMLIEKFSSPRHQARITRGAAFVMLLRWYGDDDADHRLNPMFIDYSQVLEFIDVMKNMAQVPKEDVVILASEGLRSLGLLDEEIERFRPYLMTMIEQVIVKTNSWLRSTSYKLSPNNQQYWQQFFNFFDLLPIALPRPDVDFIFSASVIEQDPRVTTENLPHLWRDAQPVDGRPGYVVPAQQDLVAGLAMLNTSGFGADNPQAQRLHQGITALEQMATASNSYMNSIDRLDKLELNYQENITPEILGKSGVLTALELEKLRYEIRRLRELKRTNRFITKRHDFLAAAHQFAEQLKTNKKTGFNSEMVDYFYNWATALEKRRQSQHKWDWQRRTYLLQRELSWDQFADWAKDRRSIAFDSPEALDRRIEQAELLLTYVNKGKVPPVIVANADKLIDFIREWNDSYPFNWYRKHWRRGQTRNANYLYRFKWGETHAARGTLDTDILMDWFKENLEERLSRYQYQLKSYANYQTAVANYPISHHKPSSTMTLPEKLAVIKSRWSQLNTRPLLLGYLPEKFASYEVLSGLRAEHQQLKEMMELLKRRHANTIGSHHVPGLISHGRRQLMIENSVLNLFRHEDWAGRFRELLAASVDNPLVPWKEAEGLTLHQFLDVIDDRQKYVGMVLDQGTAEDLDKLLVKRKTLEEELKQQQLLSKFMQLEGNRGDVERKYQQARVNFFEQMKELDLVIQASVLEPKPAEPVEVEEPIRGEIISFPPENPDNQ